MSRKPSSVILAAAIIGVAIVIGSAFAVSAGERNRVCASPAVVFDEDAGMKEPKVVHKVDPKYPKEALKEGASGEVVLDVVIDANGVVGDMSVIETPHASLSAAAEKALQQWRFEPARDKSGEPLDVCYVVTIEFHLK